MSPDRGDSSPLGSTHDPMEHNGHTKETIVRQSRAETLRSSIVEMAGRAPPGTGLRHELATRTSKYAQHQSPVRLGQPVATAGTTQNTSQNVTVLVHTKERIDVDTIPTSTRRDTTRQQQQQISSSPHRPQPPTASPPSPKDRASAWLLRRFRRRHLKMEKPVHVTPAKARENQEGQECREPVKKSPISAQSSKRVALTRPKSVKFQADGDSSPCTSSLFPSTGSSGANRVNQYDGNDKEENQTNQQNTGIMNFMKKVRHTGVEATDNKDVNNNIGKSENVRVAEEIYEVRGNAIPTPPPRQSSARRVGLFSASLEAFKRRLRVSSSKYSQRVYGQEMEGVDSYIITTEDTSLKDPRSPHQKMTGNFGHSSRAQQKTDDKQRAATPFKPRLISNGQNAFNSTLKLQESTRQLDPNSTLQSLSNFTSYPSIQLRPYMKTRQEPATTPQEELHLNLKQEQPEDKKQKGNDQNSPSKPPNSPTAPTKFSYKLPEDTSTKEVSFNEEEEVKQPLPNVKTYVVESDSSSALKSKLTQPVPLTIHNLRLHDSLNSIYERRMRRMERCNRNKFTKGVPTFSNDSSDGSPSERMLQWLAEVSELTVIQAPPAAVAVQITVESLALDLPTTGAAVHGRHGFTEPIFV